MWLVNLLIMVNNSGMRHAVATFNEMIIANVTIIIYIYYNSLTCSSIYQYCHEIGELLST